MKNRVYNILVLAAVLLAFAGAAGAEPQSSDEQSVEYQVKAAFLFNFIKFVDWPAGQKSDGNEPMIIGIIGDDPFGDAFEPVKDKLVRGRKIIVSRFKSLDELKKGSGKDELSSEIGDLKRCNVLFICQSEKDKTREIAALMKGLSVLTVVEGADMLDAGGVIRLFMEDKKVCFEVNLSAAAETNLRISSQLLRMAKKVIKNGEVVSMNNKNSKSGTGEK